MATYNPKRANETRYTVASPGNGGKVLAFNSVAPLHRFCHLRGATEAAWHYTLQRLHAALRDEIVLRNFLYTLTWNGNVFLPVAPFVQLTGYFNTAAKENGGGFTEDTLLGYDHMTATMGLRKHGIVRFAHPPMQIGEIQALYPTPKGAQVLNTWLTTHPSQNTVIRGFTA